MSETFVLVLCTVKDSRCRKIQIKGGSDYENEKSACINPFRMHEHGPDDRLWRSSAGSSSSGGSSDAKVIKIGVFEPTTGENGGGGFQEVLGIRYANKVHPTVKVGEDEYKIELVEVDNKSDKTEASMLLKSWSVRKFP